MLAGAAIAISVATCIHTVHAKGYVPPELSQAAQAEYKINPRGPGGPPVVIEDDEATPRWKLVVTVESPMGKQSYVYGSQEEGVHWYASQEACEKARNGGDPKLAKSLKLLNAQVKASKMPLEVKVECKPDNSV
jgi:hypothetical protein